MFDRLARTNGKQLLLEKAVAIPLTRQVLLVQTTCCRKWQYLQLALSTDKGIIRMS